MDVEEDEKIMSQIHGEICGSHLNGYVLDIKDTSRVLMTYDGMGLLLLCKHRSSLSR